MRIHTSIYINIQKRTNIFERNKKNFVMRYAYIFLESIQVINNKKSYSTDFKILEHFCVFCVYV